MIKFFLPVFLAFSILFFGSIPPTHSQRLFNSQNKFVTYDLGGGRFGDQLMGYIHAKWISYKHGIPLLYRPFIYSDQLVLHYEERPYLYEKRKLKTVYLGLNKVVDFNRRKSELYIIPYFPESNWELTKGNDRWYYFKVNWDDPGFKQELKKMIVPLRDTSFLEIPNDRVSVAIHVRKGGGFDEDDTWKSYPMKFPPSSYYIEQIRKISQLFDGNPLYVHVFTDHQAPLDLVEQYQNALMDLDIQFSYRGQGNHHASNVVEDFFEMMRFDCLVIPDSNFSIIPSKLRDYKVVISPVDFQWQGDTIYIDKISIKTSFDFFKMEENE